MDILLDGLDFWIPAVGVTLAVAVLTALALLRGAGGGGEAAGVRRELRVYADQLREIERDAARGVIAPDEAGRLRAETARRLLEADRAGADAAARAPRPARALALALVAAAVAVAAGVYAWRGAALYRDRPLTARLAEAAALRANRPGQAELEAAWAASGQRPAPPEPDPQFAALMDRLRATVAERPDDLTGQRLLAQNEARLERFAAAARAQARVLELLPDDTPPAERLEELQRHAQFLIAATGGLVSPEAEAVLETILRRDPENGFARFFLGVMFDQTGRPDLTFRIWRRLLEDSPPDAPWVPDLRANLETLAAIAGVRYTLPPEAGTRGPTRGDIEAAASMDAQARQAMITSMVEGLAERLAAQGGPAQDWARLVQALGVLGQTARAGEVWAEARRVFAEDPEGMALIDAAARAAGLDG